MKFALLTAISLLVAAEPRPGDGARKTLAGSRQDVLAAIREQCELLKTLDPEFTEESDGARCVYSKGSRQERRYFLSAGPDADHTDVEMVLSVKGLGADKAKELAGHELPMIERRLQSVVQGHALQAQADKAGMTRGSHGGELLRLRGEKSAVRAGVMHILEKYRSGGWTIEENDDRLRASYNTGYENGGLALSVYLFAGAQAGDIDVEALYEANSLPASERRRKTLEFLLGLPEAIRYAAFTKGEKAPVAVIVQAPAAAGAPAQPQAPAAKTALSKEDIAQIVAQTMEAQERKPEARKEAPPKAPVSDVDKPLYIGAENPSNFAVVVGIEKYPHLPPATFAKRDAEAVRNHLVGLGYPARNILLLTNEDATLGRLSGAFNTWLANRVKEDSTVFFYYSGHGAPDAESKTGYLVTFDGDPEDLADTAYPLKNVYGKLAALKARRVIVALDSCFSGAGGRSVLAKGTRPLVTKIDVGELATAKIVALSASSGEQISGTMEDQGHGLFTYYLLKGLNGAAQNASGRVTVGSLYEYLAPKVQDAAQLDNRHQTPQMSPAKPEEVPLR